MINLLKLQLSVFRKSIIWRILTNTGWATAATPITICLGIVETSFLAHMLGPSGLGIITLFTAVCGLLGGLFKFDSSEAVLVYTTKAITEGNQSQACQIINYCYSLDFLTSVFAFSVIILLSLIIPKLLNLNPSFVWLQILYGLTIIFQSTYWTSHAILRMTNHFSLTFYQTICQSIITTGLIFLFYLLKFGLKEVIFLLIILSLFNGLSIYIIAQIILRKKDLHINYKTFSWRSISPTIWKFQFLGYGRKITKLLYRYLDILLLGHLSNVNSVGLFRSAQQITDTMSIPSQGLVSSLFPEYSALWFSGDRVRLKRIVIQFTLFLLSISILLTVLIIVFSDSIIRIVFGNAFMSAKPTLIVLLLATFIAISMIPLNSFQVATGDAKPSMVAGIATILCQILLIIFLVPTIGILGAAWARVGGILASVSIMVPTALIRLKEKKSD